MAEKRKQKKRTFRCHACRQEFDSPLKLGWHYDEHPGHAPPDREKKREERRRSHRDRRRKGDIREPEDVMRPLAEPTDRGLTRAERKRTWDVLHSLQNVLRLMAGFDPAHVVGLDGREDGVAQGLWAWAQKSAENEKAVVSRIMDVLASKRVPAVISPDEIELRKLEIEAQREGAGQPGGANVQVVMGELPLAPAVAEAKRIEAKQGGQNGAGSDAGPDGGGWDDFEDEDGPDAGGSTPTTGRAAADTDEENGYGHER